MRHLSGSPDRTTFPPAITSPSGNARRAILDCAQITGYSTRGLVDIAARVKEPPCSRWTGSTIKRQYDFSKGKRGTVVPLPPEKVHITIRLDRDAVECGCCTVPEIRKL